MLVLFRRSYERIRWDYWWLGAIVGSSEWSRKGLVVVPLIFSLVQGSGWLTSIVWAFMIGGLLAYTRSLGAGIVAHGVTNLLLGLYVLWTKQWFFW